MKNLFSYDSKFMSVLTVIADTMLLNVLFLLLCLPVVTIGPAAVGLFTACRAMTEDEPCFRAFFRGFRGAFPKALFAWLLELVGILLFGGCILWIWGNREILGSGFVPPLLISALVLILLLSVANMTFLFYSRFECTFAQLMKNSLFMTLGHLLRALLMGLFMWAPVLLFLLLPDTFWQLGIAWVLFYSAAVANVCVRIMKKPFERIAEQAGAAQEKPAEEPEKPEE